VGRSKASAVVGVAEAQPVIEGWTSLTPLRRRSYSFYNTPPFEVPMPFSIRSFRRFPVHGFVTYNTRPFLTLPLASCSSFGALFDDATTLQLVF